MLRICTRLLGLSPWGTAAGLRVEPRGEGRLRACGGFLPGGRVGPLRWQSRGGKRWWAQHHPESPPARHKKPHCKVHPNSEALVAGWRPPQAPGQCLTPGKPGLRNYAGNRSQRPAEGKPDASPALEGGALWGKPSLPWNILPLEGGPPLPSPPSLQEPKHLGRLLPPLPPPLLIGGPCKAPACLVGCRHRSSMTEPLPKDPSVQAWDPPVRGDVADPSPRLNQSFKSRPTPLSPLRVLNQVRHGCISAEDLLRGPLAASS